ncbi:hypothetical protein [Rhizobium sp. MHM7A]|uniref:hypothetical protein n=1 Tax=Rhizobium sp. MHM7A TaxID=2583233 RepID=UPI001106A39D|nr:hypothetical protein [Rhizobium sp. MHM7A]TLX16293.1 hypothetical protein FFR93_02895 [Rhizobium sp. MHM7A]
MRAPTRQLSRTTNFGSLAAAHVNFKAEVQARTERTANLQKTQEAVYSGTRLDEVALDRVATLFANPDAFRDTISDAQARANQGRVRVNDTTPDRPENPHNLPAIFSNKLVVATGEFYPQWHLVRNLPAYLREPIRAVGRIALASFTRTDMEEVRLTSSAVASEAEIGEMMSWIRNNGSYVEQPDKERMNFAGLLNGSRGQDYEALVKLYEVDGVDFLLVRDDHGKYIYSWPTRDRIGLELRLENDQQPLRIGR